MSLFHLLTLIAHNKRLQDSVLLGGPDAVPAIQVLTFQVLTL
jgi:hypothetical protein